MKIKIDIFTWTKNRFVMLRAHVKNFTNRNYVLESCEHTQLVRQYIIICRGPGSNPGHPTYSPYKVNSNHWTT